MAEIIRATTQTHLEEVRTLFLEYADFLGFDLSFQGFEEELAGLPGEYSSPEGRLLLSMEGDRAAGCVALRRISAEICEMKRLYVRPECRGTGTGMALVKAIVDEAQHIGYRRMRLDTVPALRAAIGLYRSVGFHRIDPYRFNPVKGATFWELDLDGVATPRMQADDAGSRQPATERAPHGVQSQSAGVPGEGG